ncbi:cytochrome c peroxidase [Arboricoccus pini]|uniref:Cytochrome c peroxidase n=1 Tax=Arboricoccus pini TaxID=1963835 RepID=A0A212RPR0_9PROT|nr:cytochrome c peroxidase [Arboricoccus pini]
MISQGATAKTKRLPILPARPVRPRRRRCRAGNRRALSVADWLVRALAGVNLAFLTAIPAVSAQEAIVPIPLHQDLDLRKVKLGASLFRDPRLSHDNSNSCSTCHLLERGGADGLPLSAGLDGKPGMTNTPTVFNSAFNFRLNWDGRGASLATQLDAAIKDPTVMGATWPEIIDKLKADKRFSVEFTKVYPQGLTPDATIDALVTYERSLTTPDAPFDRYLRGDVAAVDADELEGYRLFKAYGCIACHQGMNVGGNMMQVFGVLGDPGDYFRGKGSTTPFDTGLYRLTGKEEDKFVFRVPSLRNVALTAPYFNDGSATTLPDAIRIMAKYQLGRPISERDVDLIVAFLQTLTGDYEGKPLDAPSASAAAH